MDTKEPAWYSPTRELLAIVGALLVGTNILPENAIEQILGAILVFITIILGIQQNAGIERMLTLGRKLLSVLPGAFMAMGWITPELGASLLAFLGPVVSMAWAIFLKKSPPLVIDPMKGI